MCEPGDYSVESKERPIFRELTADDDNPEVTEIESLCMTCGNNGTTRLLLTKIPMFLEVIVSSFQCPHCGATDSSIQSGASLQDQGVKYSLKVHSSEHLSRMVVMAETASVTIPELDFEIPAGSKKGAITTVEGILTQSLEELEKEQPQRKALHPEIAAKLEVFIDALKACAHLKRSFTLIVDDPSGNSFVENPFAPGDDVNLTIDNYLRSDHQNRDLGLATTTTSEVSNSSVQVNSSPDFNEHMDKDDVMGFATNCSHCNSPAETRMKLVDIPNFKQVIVMATACDCCGYKSNEVKSGMGVSEMGSKISLRLTDTSDLSRDVLKSETAVLMIPELNLECEQRSLGGRFTTIEGLLTEVRDQLQKFNPFSGGDSDTKTNFKDFIKKLSEVIDGTKLNVEIILDDPTGNSYIQSIYAPEPDPEMTVTHYQRTFEQNEVLGLNDMKTEHYSKETET